MSRTATELVESHDQFHDAASEISSVTESNSGELTTEPSAKNTELESSFEMRDEAEDECGELNPRCVQSHNTKRFSSLSMASSIAAIMPFISESKLTVGFITLSNDQERPERPERPAKSSLSHDLSRPMQYSHHQRMLRGSMPQLSQLLQNAAANAQSENISSFSAKTVDDWASSLTESFHINGPVCEIKLKYPVVEATNESKVPSSPQKQVKSHKRSMKWKLRPLSTWGRKSIINPLWSSEPSPASSPDSAPTLRDCDNSVISSFSKLFDHNIADNAADGMVEKSANDPQDEHTGHYNSSARTVNEGVLGNTKTADAEARSSTTNRDMNNSTKVGNYGKKNKVQTDSSANTNIADRKHVGTGHIRNSRFWQSVRPTAGSTSFEKEPIVSLCPKISEESIEKQDLGTLGISSGSTSHGAKRKDSRLRRFWHSLMPNSTRHNNHTYAPYSVY